MNPQNNFNQQNQFGGNPNIQYTQPEPAQPAPQQMPEGAVPMNVINAVNANGIVTGDKVVSYIWKRVGICAMIIAAACLIGVGISALIMNNVNQEKNKMELAKLEADNNLAAIYESLGAEEQSTAITRINDVETLNGGDISEINDLLTERFGSDYVLDIADQNVNFVRKSGAYKIVSLGIRRNSGSVRAIMYERIADGNWIMSSFDSTNLEDPCADSPKEEKIAISGLDVCPVNSKEE